MNISIFTFIFHEPWKFSDLTTIEFDFFSEKITLHFTKALDMKDQPDQVLRKSELFKSFQMDFHWSIFRIHWIFWIYWIFWIVWIYWIWKTNQIKFFGSLSYLKVLVDFQDSLDSLDFLNLLDMKDHPDQVLKSFGSLSYSKVSRWISNGRFSLAKGQA